MDSEKTNAAWAPWTGFGMPGIGNPMPVDIIDDDGKYFVNAYIPGFEPDDIYVKLGGGKLLIRAGKEPPTPDDGFFDGAAADPVNFVVHEQTVKYAERAFQVPACVDESWIDADYVNGVLSITLRKTDDPELIEYCALQEYGGWRPCVDIS